MRRLRFGFALIGVLIAALVTGCGQKGPLYLPEQKTPPASPQNPPVKP